MSNETITSFRELFRCKAVTDLMIHLNDVISYKNRNKMLVGMHAKSHHECLENRCKVLDEPDAHKINDNKNWINVVWRQCK